MTFRLTSRITNNKPPGERKRKRNTRSISHHSLPLIVSIFRFPRQCWKPRDSRIPRDTDELVTNKLSASFAKIKATLCRTGSNSRPRRTAGTGTFALPTRSPVFRIFLRRLSLSLSLSLCENNESTNLVPPLRSRHTDSRRPVEKMNSCTFVNHVDQGPPTCVRGLCGR